MRFHLDAKCTGLRFGKLIHILSIRAKMLGSMPFNHGGIVFIGAEGELWRMLMSIFNHAEQRMRHVVAIDAVAGVKNFVPTMF